MACILWPAACRPTWDRTFAAQLSPSFARAALSVEFSSCGDTFSLKSGWRLCVCCFAWTRRAAMYVSFVLSCSASVLYFCGVSAATRRQATSCVMERRVRVELRMQHLLRSVSTCGACTRAERDYRQNPRAGGVICAHTEHMQSCSRARQR